METTKKFLSARTMIKEYVSGLPGKEYCAGIILSVGTKYVTWLSLYEGATKQKFLIADFAEVIEHGGFDRMLGEYAR